MSKYNFVEKHLSDYGGFIEGKAAVLVYFVKRLPIIRMYWFPKLVAGKGPIQSRHKKRRI